MRITGKLFISLAAAAAVSLAGAVGVYTASNTWSPGEVTGERAFPALQDNAAEIARIEIVQGGETLEIARDGGKWVASSRDGYPVSTDQVRKLILRLTEAELIEPKTRDPSKYSLLELGDPDKKDTKARRLRLLDSGGGVFTEAVLGRKSRDAFGSGRSGTYVRKPGNDRTWLSSLDTDADTDIRRWADTRVFTTSADRIQAITVEHPGEEPLKIVQTAAEQLDFRLDGLDENEAIKEDGPSMRSMADGYAGVEFEDVRKQKTSGGGEGIRARVETKDGLTLTFRYREQDGAHWISMDAAGSGDAAKRAEEINARVKGWEYKVPSWKADILFKHRSEFVKTS